jgi:hypothetical protein
MAQKTKLEMINKLFFILNSPSFYGAEILGLKAEPMPAQSAPTFASAGYCISASKGRTAIRSPKPI